MTLHAEAAALAGPHGVDVTIVYEGDPGAAPPAAAVDGFFAEPVGAARRATTAWTVILDAEITDPERFREARQLALYFASALGPSDVARVVIPRGALDSGWRSLDQLTDLRAPLDATLDPAPFDGPRAGAVEAPDAGPPPGHGLPLDVLIGSDARGSYVRLSVQGAREELVIRVGEARRHGPRLVAETRGRVARTSVATYRAPCLAPGSTHELRVGEERVRANLTYDPGAWPLEVDATVLEDDRVTVRGRFCWGSERERASATFEPGGVTARALDADGEHATFALPKGGATRLTVTDTGLARTLSRPLSPPARRPRLVLWASLAAVLAGVAGIAGAVVYRLRRRG